MKLIIRNEYKNDEKQIVEAVKNLEFKKYFSVFPIGYKDYFAIINPSVTIKITENLFTNVNDISEMLGYNLHGNAVFIVEMKNQYEMPVFNFIELKNLLLDHISLEECVSLLAKITRENETKYENLLNKNVDDDDLFGDGLTDDLFTENITETDNNGDDPFGENNSQTDNLFSDELPETDNLFSDDLSETEEDLFSDDLSETEEDLFSDDLSETEEDLFDKKLKEMNKKFTNENKKKTFNPNESADDILDEEEKNIKNLMEEYFQSRHKMKKFELENNSLLEKVTILEKENKELDIKVTKISDKNKEFQMKIDTLQFENKELNSKIEYLEYSYKKEQEKLINRYEENVYNKNKAISEMNSDLEKYKKQIRKVRDRNKKLEEINKKLEEEKKALDKIKEIFSENKEEQWQNLQK